jgi:hypothetical protein
MANITMPITAVVPAAHTPSGRLARLLELHARMRRHAREGGLPYWRQAVEMAYLKVTRDIGVHYYDTARMWRNEMPWHEKVGHIGSAAYLRALASANPVEYRKLSQHKLAEKAILTLLGIPTPRFLGMAHTLGGRSATGEPLETADDFARFLSSIDATRLCFKLMEGQSGSGFIAAHVRQTADGPILARIGGPEEYSPAEFHARYIVKARAGRLIEVLLDQHPDLAWFNETSVNTVRIVAYARRDEHARVLGAYLRMGRLGSVVDNYGAGGLLASVDRDTGIVGEAFDANRETHRCHPDTGRMIKGRRIPYWRECVDLVERTLDAFPRMRFAGFDVAVAPTGPVVIEMNNVPGTDGVACTNMQMARALRE